MKPKLTKTFWRFVVRRPDGTIRDESPVTPNLNTYEGAQFFLDLYFEQAIGYTAAWFCGLIAGVVTPDRTDTAAKITTGVPNPPTTNNWAESTDYSEATRQRVIFGVPYNMNALSGVGAIGNQASPCIFTMTDSGALVGGFMVSTAVKGSTTGKLYCVDQGAGGLAYGPGDTIEVQIATGFVSEPG